MSEAIPPVGICRKNLPRRGCGDFTSPGSQISFDVIVNSIGAGHRGERYGAIGIAAEIFRRCIPFGEIRVEGHGPGESLRSSPGYNPEPLRGKSANLVGKVISIKSLS